VVSVLLSGTSNRTLGTVDSVRTSNLRSCICVVSHLCLEEEILQECPSRPTRVSDFEFLHRCYLVSLASSIQLGVSLVLSWVDVLLSW